MPACGEKSGSDGECECHCQRQGDQADGNSQCLEECLGLAKVREQLLLLLKLLTMNTAATATQLHGVLEVQHLVIHDVLNGTAGHERMVKDAAHHDGVMGGIVVTEGAP